MKEIKVLNPRAKKPLLWCLGGVVLLFAVLLVLPFAFSGKIVEVAKKQINEMLNAQVDFEKISLSFIRDFPNASVGIKNIRVIGVDEFQQDTLFSGKEIRVVVNLMSLFSDSGYEVREIRLDRPYIYAHILPDGKVNWDIMKSDSTKVKEEEPEGTTTMSFRLQLRDFTIKDANIVYWDEKGKTKAEILGLNHHTEGDFSASTSLIETATSIQSITVGLGGVNYLSKASFEFNVDVEADLDSMRFVVSKNYIRLNDMALALDGWVDLLEPEGMDMDLTLNTEKIQFKSILSMVPALYAKDFDGLKAKGSVTLNAAVKGRMVGETYPAFNVKLAVADGQFQYPALPKSVDAINIDIKASSPGGSLDRTVVDVSRFSLSLGKNPFAIQARLATPISDPDFSVKANGKLDLGMVKDFYPLGDDLKLNGVFTADLSASGRMSYVKNNQYQKFNFAGNLGLSNLLLKLAGFKDDIAISQAGFVFNNRYADLSTGQIKIGRNDVALRGKLENYVAYALLENESLKGQLDVSSNYLNLNDFMSDTPEEKKPEEASTEPMTVIEIPKNIDAALNANFKELIFGQMQFKDARGALRAANGELKINNLSLLAFGGSMKVSGVYSTVDPKVPKANLNLNINEIEFTQIFKQVETLQKVAPIFESATGRGSIDFALRTTLLGDMSPDLKTLYAKGKLTSKSVGLHDVSALNSLADALKRPDLKSLSLKNVSIAFELIDGRLHTEPFDINVADTKLTLGGSSGLDQTLDYKGNVQLPDNLGLGKLSKVGVSIGGTFSSPKVKVDVLNTLKDIVDDAKAKVTEEVNKQVDKAKAEVTQKVDEAKAKADAELQKKRGEAVAAARAQGDKLQAEAQKAGDKLVEEARKQSESMVSKASNPIAKKAAQVAGDKLVKEAQSKSDGLKKNAQQESEKLVKQAEQL
ncbi:AsmA-like C-terminal region-containing protein [Candidatus Symbiothrix dinenymphae]|uniref:AsmA-like C-terminal region-containing protein n=1 Tax=Candidatus Symbiothrix dinenymphae TaxID=467085 RepID=UPI0006C0CBEB|nr:AsmA-like C-terminal region-containing protein [Candidatus Symbiothrix dinenymphae]GAP73351.1 outer membrane assembly protein [Candidatus Symbiothrix dinenymphae]